MWELVRRQHGVIARRQLLELGLGARDVDRRVASGRLHVLWRGVYAVGRPQVDRRGWWLAAVLACGPRAVLSHASAAALWGIRREADRAAVVVSVPTDVFRRRPGTDSALERRFVPIARRAGLPVPETRRRVNGFRVDFFWPDLGLVVETYGLRFHRTPAQQAADRRRDQAHAIAGMTPLRFTHAQVSFEAGYVSAALSRMATRLRAASHPQG